MTKNNNNSDAEISRQVDNNAALSGKAAKSRRVKLWLDFVMLVSLVGLAIVLWVVTPEQYELAPLFDDLDMLAGSQQPEFYQDLEFFYWLELQHGQD